MQYYLKYFLLLYISLWTSIVQAENAAPIVMLDGVAKEVIASLEQKKISLKSHPAVVYQIVNKILLPHVDVNGMSRSVLGRANWQRATTEQKSIFAREFTRLVVHTYAGALTNYTGEKVRFYPLAAGLENQSYIQVKSVIVRPNGQNISLSYSLVRAGSTWKIYDMSVEGVSLLQSFRSQFAAELSKGSFQELLDKLIKHNAK